MPFLVIDIETTGLKTFTGDKINMIGVKNLSTDERIYFIRNYTDHITSLEYLGDTYDIRELEKFQAFIDQQENPKFIMFNGKFDSLFMLQKMGIDIPIHHDPMILGYLLTTAYDLMMNRRNGILSLNYLAKKYLHVDAWDVSLKEKTSISRDSIIYLSKDLDHTGDLFKVLYSKLSKEDKVTYSIIVRALNAFRDMEYNGIPIDVTRLVKIQKEYKEKLAQVDMQLNLMFPKVNFNSSVQVAEIIYDQLGFPVKKLTKAGRPSVAVGALKELEGKHEVIDLILEKRKYEKGYGYMVDWKEKEVHGRIHPNFNLHTTITGRTSSNGPNIQQVPRTKEIKGLFTAPAGKVIVQIDYSQMELRIASVVARVPAMKEAYRNNQDIHTEMAKDILGTDEVTKSDRALAKPVNFGFIYGLAAQSFPEYAKTTFGLDTTLEQAIDLRMLFFKKYPELVEWYEEVKTELFTYGEVKTLFGRRYQVGFSNILSRSQQSEFSRKSINAKVQSPASDYALLGLIDLHSRLKEFKGIKLCAAVHDSIILEADLRPGLKEDLKKIGKILEKPRHVEKILKYLGHPQIDIPIVADIEIGPWGSGVDIDSWEEMPF